MKVETGKCTVIAYRIYRFISTFLEKIGGQVECDPVVTGKQGPDLQDLEKSLASLTQHEAQQRVCDESLNEGDLKAISVVSVCLSAGMLTIEELKHQLSVLCLQDQRGYVRAAFRQYAAAVKWSEENELPSLEGSDLQMMHAELVRHHVLKPYLNMGWVSRYPSMVALIQKLIGMCSAKTWLDVFGIYNLVRNRPASNLWKPRHALGSKSVDDQAQNVLASLEQVLAREAATSDLNETVMDEDFLVEVEKEHRLRALRSTSDKQKQYARRIRVKWLLNSSDAEQVRSIRSAPELLREWKKKHRHALGK